MAQKMTVALEEDLDGGPADETARLGLGGTEYEIDLSKKNAAAVRRKLEPFIEHARKADEDKAADGAYPCEPGAQRRYPGVGERPGHRGQRARAHPRQRR